MNKIANQGPLSLFSKSLLQTREAFHKSGRLDDSNSKFDEIIKLIAIELGHYYHPESGIPSLSLVLGRYRQGLKFSLITELDKYLKEASRLSTFTTDGNESLFGQSPSFVLFESDTPIIINLMELVVQLMNSTFESAPSYEHFELLNEAFGHFVRDNFRNNIEDAQYMTPPEVVIYMCKLAMTEIPDLIKSHKKDFVMADPACGVGSFLAQFYASWNHSGLARKYQLRLVGQDKVDRMVRLSRINMLLYGITDALITRGNSLIGASSLDRYNEKCDLILTNPPFGARINSSEIRENSDDKYPLLTDIIKSTESMLDSELLFLDRYISLLKPGGTALVVVPDGVISAKGLPALIRERLAEKAELRSLTELPSVTFGQAGTRTKTCIVHFVKKPAVSSHYVFMASAKSLGFEVSSRKGVPVKRPEGDNELLGIYNYYPEYRSLKPGSKPKILSAVPSCVAVPRSFLTVDSWTPNHHSASRYNALINLSKLKDKSEIDLFNLHDLVLFPNRSKIAWPARTMAKCISVLHVGSFGFLDVQEIMSYNPKYPGQPCEPGDVLFSKINPRIPRAVVVPDLGFPVTCSTEFEVLRSRNRISNYGLMLLLLSPFVQAQVQSLTSGTSSSHNRIKIEQLEKVQVPIPRDGSPLSRIFKSLVSSFSIAAKELNGASISVYKCMKRLEEIYKQ